MEELRAHDPRRIGAYNLRARIGAGGQGQVFLGLAPDGGSVAVKVLTAAGLGDTQGRTRLDREVQAARSVARFCTAAIVDADVMNDPPYIVSEYVPGKSLQQAVDEGGPVAGTALERLAVGTATALSAIHQAGIVHRDFKPGNVLMGPDGPRVIDFGIARGWDQGSVASAVVGTPAYMAPEQFRGDVVGPAVDVFAWAGTMVFAATGRPPFGVGQAAAIMYRVLNSAPDLSGLAGGRLMGIVGRCLDPDPGRRPHARAVLGELLGESPEQAMATMADPGGVPSPALSRGDLAAASAAGAIDPSTMPASQDAGLGVSSGPPPTMPGGGSPDGPRQPYGQAAPPRKRRGLVIAGAALGAVVLAGAAFTAVVLASGPDAPSQPKYGRTEACRMIPKAALDKVAKGIRPRDPESTTRKLKNGGVMQRGGCGFSAPSAAGLNFAVFVETFYDDSGDPAPEIAVRNYYRGKGVLEGETGTTQPTDTQEQHATKLEKVPGLGEQSWRQPSTSTEVDKKEVIGRNARVYTLQGNSIFYVGYYNFSNLIKPVIQDQNSVNQVPVDLTREVMKSVAARR